MNGRTVYWGVLTVFNVLISLVFAFKGDDHVFAAWFMIGFCWYMMERSKDTEDKNV